MVSGELTEKAGREISRQVEKIEQEACRQSERTGQESCGKAKKIVKQNVYPDRGGEKKRDWLCSRFFLLAAFLCLFANQDVKAPGLFPGLFSAGIQAVILRAAETWTGMGRAGNRDEKSLWRREKILLAVGFAGMLCAQLLLFTQAGGYPEDSDLWIKGWGGLSLLGEWVLRHWKAAGIAVIGCVDLSVLAAVRFARKQTRQEGHAGADSFRVFFLLFLLLGISPWILVPQPLFFVMPVVTVLMLYAAWNMRETDGEQGGGEFRKKGCLAGGAAVVLFFFCFAVINSEGAGIGAVFEGKTIPQLPLYWFESVKSSLSDGTFGWLSGPKLIPFTMNGQALRLQNTIYPGADRYGWYAGLVQGAWVLLLWMEAAVPVKRAGKETICFLIVMLLLPLWQSSGGCMAAVVFLPWLAVRACLKQ